VPPRNPSIASKLAEPYDGVALKSAILCSNKDNLLGAGSSVVFLASAFSFLTTALYSFGLYKYTNDYNGRTEKA
jgi:hypothetical protein